MYSLGGFEFIPFPSMCPEKIAYLTTQTSAFADALQK